MKNIKALTTACLFAAVTLPTPSYAGVECQTKIQRVMTFGNGDYTILAFGRWLKLCNSSTAWNGISTQTCNMWAAQTQSALLTGKDVLITYLGVASTVACEALPFLENSPTPHTVQLLG